MGPTERDWVDVANNVLLKCRINLRLERISECDANVFVALYEAILGEKVPDYVAAKRQEDDIHNVQSVIDSLALDYLQISLSHITGENIVRGEKESIRNLLEIFDGLLDYLAEQQSDEMKHKENTGKTSVAIATYQPQKQETDQMQYQSLTIQLSNGEGSLSWHDQRNGKAEQELHNMSEKLSRRLEELDLMLKRALSETGETCEPGEEDKQLHHGNSIMDCVTSSCHSRAHGNSLPSFLSPAQRNIQQNALTGDLYNANHSHQHKSSQKLENHHAVCREASSGQRSCIKSPCSRTSITKLQRTARKDTPSMRVKDSDLLPILLEELPQVQLSSHTVSRMWKQQLRHIDQLSFSQNQNPRTQPKLLKQLEEAHKRHDMLVQIINKEKEHNRYLREFREKIQQQKSAQNKLKVKRQQVALAKKYYSVYHAQLHVRLMQAKTQEEQKFKLIFEEGLELQKAYRREQRAYTKELRQENYHKFKYEIEAMENYYRDQFSLLAETLAHERQDIQIYKKAQEKALQNMKRELRNKMEKEIGELQKVIIHNDENNYFRDLDVKHLQKRVQMASFQYTTSCLQ